MSQGNVATEDCELLGFKEALEGEMYVNSSALLDFLAFQLLAPLSLIAELVFFVAYYKLKRLRQPPGDLILWQLLSLAVVEISWLYSGVLLLINGKVPGNTLCSAIGLISSYASILSTGFNLALTTELFQKMSKPMTTHYATRVQVYHGLSHLAAAVITFTAALSGQSGLNFTNNCFILPNSFNRYSYLLYGPRSLIPIIYYFTYISLSFCILLYSLSRICVIKRRRERRLLLFHILYIAQGLVLDIMFPGYLVAISGVVIIYIGGNRHIHTWQYMDWVDVYEPWAVCCRQRASVIAGGATGLVLIVTRFVGFCWSKGQAKLVYSELYTEIPNETLATAILSLHLVFRQRSEGQIDCISNEKSTKLENCLWEFRSSSLVHHPSFQLDTWVDYIRQFRVGVFEHAPSVFSRIRPVANESDASMCKSFDPQHNRPTIESHAGNKGGRSSAFMYFTYDKRLILKTLTASEVSFLQKQSELLMDYYLSPDGRQSLLAKALGLFTIHMRDKSRLRVAVFENVFHTCRDIQTVFDIKGSKVHRKTLPDGAAPSSVLSFPPGNVYKDLDFLRLPTVPKVCEWSHITAQLAKDSALLSSIQAIDYSLLIGISPCHSHLDHYRSRMGENCIWTVGVIDYLQIYNWKKRVEKYSKRLFSPSTDGKDISVTDPRTYQARFIDFVKGMCAEPEDSRSRP